jgi:two-component system cell cycle response regulator
MAEKEGWKTMRIEALKDFDNLPRDSCLLVMLEGPSPGAIQPVGEEVVLGRGEDLPARIDDRGMSRRHARIFKLQNNFYVEDLGSTNGSRVNGTLVQNATKLENGDRIQLGETTLLRVDLVDAREAQAAKKLYESAVRDALTNLFNRGHFDERLVAEFAFAARHGVPLTVALLDIDHFKRVNDTYGHQAGDAVLQATAGAIARTIRAEDEVARYGGEEIVVVARGIDHQQGMLMGERIRATIEALFIPYDAHVIRVTASLGVATMDETTRFAQPDELLSAADRAVYRAKSSGRNRVCSSRG